LIGKGGHRSVPEHLQCRRCAPHGYGFGLGHRDHDSIGTRRDSHGNPIELDDVGRPSALVLQALDRLEHGDQGAAAEDGAAAAVNDPWRDEPRPARPASPAVSPAVFPEDDPAD